MSSNVSQVAVEEAVEAKLTYHRPSVVELDVMETKFGPGPAIDAGTGSSGPA